MMPDNEVRAEVECACPFVDGAGDFEVAAVALRPRGDLLGAEVGRQRHAVQGQALEHVGRGRGATREVLNEERAFPPVAPPQLQGEPPELRGEREVDEQDPHWRFPPKGLDTRAQGRAAHPGTGCALWLNAAPGTPPGSDTPPAAA